MLDLNRYKTIFVTTDDYPRNDEVIKLLSNIPPIECQVLNFYTMDLDILSIIAKYRVLPVPTILILNNTKVIGRIVRPPAHKVLSKLVADLPKILQ